MRAVLGAAGAGGAQSIDRSGRGVVLLRVLERMFGPDPAAAALVLPAVPLDEMYAEPARDVAEARGHEVRVNAPAKVDDRRQPRRRRARARRAHRGADRDLDGAVACVSTRCSISRRPRWRQTIANAPALASLPIVTVNLWFDRAVMHEPLVGLPGRNFQWVFDRRAIVGGAASHLSLISSGAEAIVAKSQRRAGRDGARAKCARRCRRRASATVAKEPGGAREALDLLAGARCAAAAADRDGDRGILPGR